MNPKEKMKEIEVNTETTTPKNYIFKYNLENKGIQGYKMACNNLSQIKDLKIASLSADTVRNGWIKFSNNKNDAILNHIQEAKWVLRFKKGDPSINQAWSILVDLVVKNILWDIKASAQKNDYDTQVICVYVSEPNNILEIVKAYNILLNNGLIDLHKKQGNTDINYITDEDTRLHGSKTTLTGKDIADLNKLYELKETISASMFQSKWNEFENVLTLKLQGNTIPGYFKSTYFSDEENFARLHLLEQLNNFQQENSIHKIESLDTLLKQTRATLTSNYKFTSVELLNHSISFKNKRDCSNQKIKSLNLIDWIPRINRHPATKRSVDRGIFKNNYGKIIFCLYCFKQTQWNFHGK